MNRGNGKKKKWGFLVGFFAVILIPVIIIMISSSADKDFSYRELNITLNNSFKEPDSMTKLKTLDVTKAIPELTLKDGDKTIFIYRDDKSTSSVGTLDAYAERTKGLYPDSSGAQIMSRGNYRYFYTSGSYLNSDAKSRVMVAMYESNHAFWTVDIGMYENQFVENKAFKWADSVTFTE